jgi:hypothetical protein
MATAGVGSGVGVGSDVGGGATVGLGVAVGAGWEHATSMLKKTSRNTIEDLAFICLLLSFAVMFGNGYQHRFGSAVPLFAEAQGAGATPSLVASSETSASFSAQSQVEATGLVPSFDALGAVCFR